MTPAVCVVGSVNLDIVVAVGHHPAPGETVAGTTRTDHHGGKGANQAVAAARAGARTSVVGRVGDDDAGRALRQGLHLEGVDTALLGTDPVAPSGTALIAVAADGENTIIVVAGANGQVGEDDVQRGHEVIAEADVVLLGHEVPDAAIAAAARTARGTVVLNPAPARAVAPDVLQRVGVLVPNRTELAQLSGREGAPEVLARELHHTVVVTLGAEGALLVTRDAPAVHVPAPQVAARDTTGAGDCFCGTLAARLAHGDTLADATARAVAAAAESVTRPGAR